MKGKKQLALAVILVLVTLALVATTASASQVTGQFQATNKTSHWVLEAYDSQSYYAVAANGEELRIPEGATMKGHVNMGQIVNFFAWDRTNGGEEVFFGGAQILCQDLGGDLKVTMTAVGSGVKLIWDEIPNCWHHLPNANLAPAPAPAAVTQTLTQAQFTALFTAMPQTNFDNKVSAVKAATFASKVRASLPITVTLVTK